MNQGLKRAGQSRGMFGVVAAVATAVLCGTLLMTVSPAAAQADETYQEMYRLYNPYSGEHFYTADAQERDNVIAAGWNDEGLGWYAPAKSEYPVYRLYNAFGGEHHYTLSADEKDSLIKAGWNDEGTGWYSNGSLEEPAKSAVTLYREYNPNAYANNHNYTTNKSEHDYLISLGWKDEGTAWNGMQGMVTTDKDNIQYNNYEYFDYSDAIKSGIAAKSALLVPEAADVPFTVAAENGATGVVLVPSKTEGDTQNVYLNAMQQGQAINVTPAEGYKIVSINGTAGATSFAPKDIIADEPENEQIPVVIAKQDGTGEATYTINTIPQELPKIEITGSGVSESDAGVYTWQDHGFLLQVSTDKTLVYYRDMRSLRGANPSANIGDMNFQPHETADGMFYTYAVVLGRQGGYCEGYFVVMDKNYKEIDTVTLMANTNPNHKHGEGYLDFHEIRVLGADNYLVMGYNQMFTTLPESLKGIENDGVENAYVWATTIQQQKNGKVIFETCSTDFPLFFESSAEGCNYAAATAEKPADYMHCNALDWLEDGKGNITKVLVSYRDQESLVQYDVTNGDAVTIDWIYSGKASTLKLDNYNGNCEMRADDWGHEFLSAEFGQHYCRYVVENGVKNPNKVSVYDNDTGVAAAAMAFKTDDPIPTMSRTYWFTIDDKGQTRMGGIVTAEHMMELNKAANGGEYTSYYYADHCAGVDYLSPTSVFTGCGLDMVCDFSNVSAPKTDSNYPNLKLYSGVHPVLTDYNPQTDQITFELKCTSGELNADGNPASGPGHYAYRAYKTMTNN